MSTSMRERLLAAAATRTSPVVIDGETFYVREVSAGKFSQYGELLKKDRATAVHFLLQECVVDEAGQPFLSAEDAAVVADSARVGLKLLAEVMRLSGYGDEGDAQKEPDAD